MTTITAASEDSPAEPPARTTSSDPGRTPSAQMSGADGAADSATEQHETGASGGSTVSEAAAALPQVLKVVGTVVAPTTLLTALMLYFGRQWATGFFRYFGLPSTVLDLTVQDYLIRSVDGLIIPLIIVVGAALVVLWVRHLWLEALPVRARRIVPRVLMSSAVVVGLVLVSLALADVISPVFPVSYPQGRGLSFSIGVLLLAYAVRLLRIFASERRPEQRSSRVPGAAAVGEWAAVFILVSVGLFWAVGDYANLVGTGRAQQVEATLPGSANVVAYSQKRLNLQAPGIREAICRPDAAYPFRYERLKLVLQAGNQYLFLPAGWKYANGTTLILPRSESLRLEFTPSGQAQNATC